MYLPVFIKKKKKIVSSPCQESINREGSDNSSKAILKLSPVVTDVMACPFKQQKACFLQIIVSSYKNILSCTSERTKFKLDYIRNISQKGFSPVHCFKKYPNFSAQEASANYTICLDYSYACRLLGSIKCYFKSKFYIYS